MYVFSVFLRKIWVVLTYSIVLLIVNSDIVRQDFNVKILHYFIEKIICNSYNSWYLQLA